MVYLTNSFKGCFTPCPECYFARFQITVKVTTSRALEVNKNMGKQRISWDWGCLFLRGKVPSPMYCATPHLFKPYFIHVWEGNTLLLFLPSSWLGNKSLLAIYLCDCRIIYRMLNWCCSFDCFRLEYKHSKNNMITFQECVDFWTGCLCIRI